MFTKIFIIIIYKYFMSNILKSVKGLKMQDKTRSILDELNNNITEKNKNLIIESRANHIITSAINLIEQLYQSYDLEEAKDLEKRLLSSLKNRDIKRFERGIKNIKDKHER